MSTLWAVYQAPDVGTYADRQYGSGWSHTIHFSSLSDLLEQMAQRENLRRNPAPRACAAPRPLVTRMGIAAHGNSDGKVVLDRELSPETVSTFRDDFLQIKGYLTPNAKLVLYCC